jgi:hypothetical protein
MQEFLKGLNSHTLLLSICAFANHPPPAKKNESCVMVNMSRIIHIHALLKVNVWFKKLATGDAQKASLLLLHKFQVS